MFSELMSILLDILFFLLAFVGMEFMAWFAHKYVMHGIGWFLHEDHHNNQPGFFEKNDAFFLVFALPSWLLIMFGMIEGVSIMTMSGFGIAAYGLSYFLVHDVLIHQRFDWFKKWRSPYINAIRRAHYAHHKHKGKEEGESFGLFVFAVKYWNRK